MPSNHPFELAGLGAAPFQFIGMTVDIGPHVYYHNGIRTEVGAPGQPMGSCDYCGQGIALICRVRDADGNEFKVGSDCIAKVSKEYGDKKVLTAVQQARRAHTKDRESARIDAAVALVTGPTVLAAKLIRRPHPHHYRASLGETLLDGIHWSLRCSGHTGRLRTARVIEKHAQARCAA